MSKSTTRTTLFERLKKGLEEGRSFAKGELPLRIVEVSEANNDFDARLWQAKRAWTDFAKSPGDPCSPSKFRTMLPAVLIQKEFGGIWPQTPKELFTDEEPPKFDAKRDDITIDVMGTYYPKRREITIFVRMIERFSRQHGFTYEEVEDVVRLHEYAHALVHLGVVGDTDLKDAKTFVSARNALYAAFDEKTHELLAQAVAWTVIKKADREAFDRAKTFVGMLDHQPGIYSLSPILREHLSLSDLANFLAYFHEGQCSSNSAFADKLRATFEKQPA